jgi:hypothetical protein
MKLNNYQKVLAAWGIILLVGYILSVWLFQNITYFFAMWFALTIIGLLVQFKFGGFKEKSSKWIQGLWIVVILGGIVLNIFEYMGTIPLFGGNPMIGWPLAMIFAYGVIAIIYKLNVSYLLLALLYLVFAGVFMITDFNLGLIVSGIFFLVLCSVDALLEGSALRKKSLLGEKIKA